MTQPSYTSGPLDQLESVPLRGTERAENPFLSPHGDWVGFMAGGAMQKVSILGGSPVTICALPAELRGASWGSDDMIVFGTAGNSGLMRVSAAGGEPAAITSSEGGRHRFPDVLPRSAGVLFTQSRAPGPGNVDVMILDMEANESRVLVSGGSNPRYSPTGHIVYGVAGTLWAVAFDPNTLQVTGDPVPVLEGVVAKADGTVSFDFSDTGSLVYISGASGPAKRLLVKVDRQGNEEPLAAEPRQYGGLRLSPDGRRVAVAVAEGELDLIIYDLARNTPTRFTFDPALDSYPVWTPDGERVVFGSNREGATDLFSKAADGTGQVEPLPRNERGTDQPMRRLPSSFSPDGRTLVFVEIRPETGNDVAMLSMDGAGEAESLLQGDYSEVYPEISPDGQWMAYQSRESGRSEIYV